MSNKKNNWLKLKVDFFTSPYHKKLRRIAGGDTFLIIYQKMMLLTVNDEGHYYYQHIEPTIEEELAFILDEELENVKMTLSYCFNCNLIENINNNTIYLTQVSQLIGKHDNSAERVAKYREIKKLEQKNKKCNALQNVTCNNVTLLEKDKDIDKDIEKDKDKEKNIKKEKSKSNADAFDYSSFDNDEIVYIQKWFDYKKEIKKPLKTKSSYTALRNQLLKLKANGTLKPSIDICIANGWTGLYEQKHFINKENKETKENKTTHDTFKNVERTGPIVVTDW